MGRFREAIVGKDDILVANLEVCGLWTALQTRIILTEEQLAECKAEKTRSTQIEKLLDILKRKDDKHFEGFCEALEVTDQNSDVKNCFQRHRTCTDSPKPAGEVCTKPEMQRAVLDSGQQGDSPHILNSIRNLRSQLSDIIEPDFGLLFELRSLGVLTQREYSDIRSERGAAYRRTDAVLDLLTSEERCNKFLLALRRTHQHHVVNLIEQRGDIGDARPLDEARMRTLIANGVHLLDLIDPNHAFVTKLAKAECITWPQKVHIVNITQPRDRNDKLLEFLARRSVADFNSFINVLSTEQARVVPLLVTTGAVVAVDAEPDVVSETENVIVSQWRDVSADEQHELRDRFNEIVRPLGFETSLVVLRRANSIALYFICLTLSAVMSLRGQWHSGQLRDMVEKLFTLLSTAANTVPVKRLIWPVTEYERCSNFFRSVQEERDSSKTKELSTDMSQLSVSKSSTHTMLEMVLMRTFTMLYVKSGKSRSAERRAFTTLASVCWNWRLTLIGWPESPTSQWVKHQVKKLIERSWRPFQRSAQFQYELSVRDRLRGVTQLHDVVFVVCAESSTILRFDATTHQRLTDIVVKDLKRPTDIAACEQTSHVYVAEFMECIWLVSADGADFKHWLPKSPDDTFRPWSLSVTSTRLLVTSRYTKQLMQLDADGNELRRVHLPDYMIPRHAVETPTGTFIVGHKNTQLEQFQVSEVNTGGEVLRQFTGSRLSSLGRPDHIAVDSLGNIVVADYVNRRILLLDADLTLRRVIIDEHQLNDKAPYRLCYREQSGQLVVALGKGDGVSVFDV